jgi:hypothetical protein
MRHPNSNHFPDGTMFSEAVLTILSFLGD